MERFGTPGQSGRSEPRLSARSACAAALNPDSDDASWGGTPLKSLSSASILLVDARALEAQLTALRDSGVTDIRARIKEGPASLPPLTTAVPIIDVSARALDFFGASTPSDLLGKDITELYHPRCAALLAAIDAFLIGVPVVQQRSKNIKLNGRYVQAISCVVNRADNLEPGYWAISIIDPVEGLYDKSTHPIPPEDFAHITRMSLVGELSASIAHEIGQPLTALTLNAQTTLAALQRGKLDQAHLTRLLERMVAQATRATTVVERVRHMARRSDSTRQIHSIDGVITDSSLFVTHDLERRGIELRLDLAAPDGAVSIDPVQIHQTLVNLMLNAAQIMELAKTEALRIDVESSLVGDKVVIEVRDNSPGIADAIIDKLFSPFFTTRREGLGLGLSISQEIIDSHEGNISAFNRPDGNSAAFRVELPHRPLP